FNINAAFMETVRTFERRCRRACMNVNAGSDYKHIDNQSLYLINSFGYIQDANGVPIIYNFPL
ncbi:hypothetical protein ALC62_05526, partial [Cyphomyrmex costatus]